MLVCFVCAPSRAETQGTAAQLIRATDLKETPSSDASSLGRLPKGTILTLKGEAKNGYVSVDVELEDGTTSGWVPRDTLDKAARDMVAEDTKAVPEDDDEQEEAPKKRSDKSADEAPVVKRRHHLIRIPKDEGLLLRRDPSFFFGLQAGGGVSIVQAPGATSSSFVGMGFSAGGHLGFYLSNNIPLRIEANYTQINATNSLVPQPLSFGYLDGSASLSYFIDDIEVFGGVGYAMGISIGANPPNGVSLPDGASDLNSPFLLAGAGYRFHLGDVTDLVLRARYQFNFIQNPVAVQNIFLMAFLQFRG